MNKFFHGTSVLSGNNTTPGIGLSPELKKYIPVILKACQDFGLDFFPTIVHKLSYDEISEIAAYGGFPVRYPHWSFGMEYESLQRGYEFGQHKIFEMVINCCELATNVLTNNGRKQACEVVVGDKIMGPNGWRDVVAVKRQVPSKIFRLKFEELGMSIGCTPNHKWKCIRDGFSVWVETKDIKVGDVVQAGGKYDKFLNHPAKFEWSNQKIWNETRANVRNRLLSISPPKQMTLELAELLGILTGDGTVGTRLQSQVFTVCVHKKLIDYQNHVRQLIYKTFGREATIDSKKSNVVNVRLASKYALDYLDTIGFKIGTTYKEKRVPSSIMASSNEFRAAYIRGLFDTDGHCSKVLCMSCYNDNLAFDVQQMLLEMGIRSKYKRVINKNNNIAVLTIKGKFNLAKFAEHIGFSLEYKQIALETLLEKDGRSGRGQLLPGIMKLIHDKIDEIHRPPEWMYKYRRRTLCHEKTSNSIYGFLKKAVLEGFQQFKNLLEISEKPVYVVESSEIEAESVETIDIALDHDDHDFIANGLISHNTNPSHIYCLASNNLADDLTVVAHATGHNDFFKNNIHFSQTDRNMLNKMANHGTRIRSYMSRWGKEKVTEFIDHVRRLETLIDGASAWKTREIKDDKIIDSREYHFPRRFKPTHNYMDDHINTKEYIKKEWDDIKRKEMEDDIGVFKNPTRDIMGFIKNNAPLKPWQSDIISMLYEEALYFHPQRCTKTANEGWASYVDYNIMSCQGYISLGQKSCDAEIINYAIHKMQVLGGKYSDNPYKLGMYLLLDIEDRWNKGKFGDEWEKCSDYREKEKWDKKLNLGKEKVFEVRKYYNDFNLINEFFTEEFCRKNEYFHWKKYPNGEYRVESKDYKAIKRNLLQSKLNGGLPDIVLVEDNFKGNNSLLLQNNGGKFLDEPNLIEVMASLCFLWKNPVYLVSADKNGEEVIYYCPEPNADTVHKTNRSKIFHSDFNNGKVVI